MLKSIPKILIDRAMELEQYYKNAYPKMSPLVGRCFLNTIETTVKQLKDGSYFVITGDIPAMWLRDSGAQVGHYVKYAKEDAQLDAIIRGILEKQIEFVLLDPYANAFNEGLNGRGHKDETLRNDGVWERKYEVDSLCAPLYLAHRYWKETGTTDVFNQDFLRMVEQILKVFRTEQDHGAKSPYRFQRFHCAETDTLPGEGKGNPVVPCGMTWSGFRPSDDRCVYGYLVPSNMMAVQALRLAAEIVTTVYGAEDTGAECVKLAEEIKKGIEENAIVHHPKIGDLYAYETDGMGNYVLMDDANTPSLLSIPYLGYAGANDEMYRRTRAFVLSKENPYYYEGTMAKGVGSPHTPDGYVWCIGIIMQALTSTSRKEIMQCLEMLAATHAGTNFMHEAFNPNEAGEYTRPWFAWANSLLGELLDRLMEEKFFER